jgi:hypothetical protein
LYINSSEAKPATVLYREPRATRKEYPVLEKRDMRYVRVPSYGTIV